MSRQTKPGAILQGIQAIWNYFTRPVASIQPEEARDRARILSSFLISLIPFLVIDLLEELGTRTQAGATEFVLVVFVAAYIFSRTRYHFAGAVMMIVALSTVPLFSALYSLNFDPDNLAIKLLWLVVGLVASINLLPLRAVFALIVLDVIEIGIITLYLQPVVLNHLLEPFDLVAIVSGLLVNAALVRQRDFQRIKQQLRAVSLAEANAREQLALAEALRDNAAALSSLLGVDEILDHILANVAHVFPNDAADVSLVENGLARIARHRGYTEGSPQAVMLDTPYSVSRFPDLRQLSEIGQPLAIPDVHAYPAWIDTPEGRWIRSYLGAPIRLDRETIGFINLYSLTPGAFTQSQAARLQAFADQAAIAIRNARFFAAELEHRQLAEALRDSIAALTSTLNLDEVLDRILTYISRVVAHDAMDIMLLETGVCRVARYRGYAERGLEEDIVNVRLKLSEVANFRWMAEHGLPIVIPDVQLYPDWVQHPMSKWIRSYVGAPIVLDGETVGFVNLNSAIPGTFDATHAERLRIFAHQVAIALRNARMFDQIRRYADTLQKQVSERTAELELERSRLQVILDATGEGIFYTEGSTIQYANPALERLTGYGQAELKGKPSGVFRGKENQNTDSRQFNAVFEAAAHGGVWRDEVKLRRKDDTEFDAGRTVSLLGDANDESRRTVTVVRDISADKALQEEKNRFVAYASHELRSPITNIITRLHLLRRQPERFDDHMAVLEEVSRRMRKLVEDLLDLSRFERGVMPLTRQDTVLQTLVTGVVLVQQPEAERKKISLVPLLEKDAVHVEADAERLIQVITNLVTNAINYTPENGLVTIRVGQNVRQGQAVVEVSDNGKGIPAHALSYIFQPFYRGDESVKGTGLGLSIAQEIIRMHGGEIQVQSEVGRGSTFTVRLPLLAGAVNDPSNSG